MSLELILGCMRSGKTSMLIRYIKRCLSIDKNILVLSHVSDTRYGNNVIATHDKVKVECICLENLNDIFESEDYTDQFNEAEFVFIEEGQFFEDIVEFCKKAVDQENKKVVVSALDGDFQRRSFKVIADLIPLADEYTKLTALCQICKDGTKAIFSKRIVDNQECKLVGADGVYLSVCRKHYFA